MGGAKRYPSMPVPRDDGFRFALPILRQTHIRDLAALIARALLRFHPLERERAQGRPGARCTRGLVCKVRKRKRTRAYRFSGGIRPSLRSGFTAYFVLSPVNGSFATV